MVGSESISLNYGSVSKTKAKRMCLLGSSRKLCAVGVHPWTRMWGWCNARLYGRRGHPTRAEKG